MKNPNTLKVVPSTASDVIEQYGPKVKGMRAKSGIVVEEISIHAAKRIVERKLSLELLEDLILNASIIYPGNKPNTICQQKGNFRLVLSKSDGTVLSIVERLH